MESIVMTGDRNLTLESWAKKRKVDTAFATSVWEAIDDPDEVPYLMERLLEGFKKHKKAQRDHIRNALMRVQMYCSIQNNSDPIKLSKQLFVTQVLERLFFGSNKLLAEGMEEHGDSD